MFGYLRNPFANQKHFCFFTLHKAGSSYVHTLLHRIFSRLKYRHEPKLPTGDARAATYFGPIRLFESVPPFLLNSSRIILQVRDPRDILTSMYFSMRYSHAVPDNNPDSFLANRKLLEKTDINDYVLQNAEQFKQRFLQLESFLDRPNVLLLFYEQMVTQFDDWFDQIIDFCGLRWNLKLRRCLNSIREEANFEVEQEDVNRHKRQVQPGDYLRKLRPDTIQQLNQEFSTVFKSFYGVDCPEFSNSTVFS